jgi:cephalosporin hydroxylase
MSELPPPVVAPLDESVRDYWMDRVRQHTHDTYAGLPLSKFPEDLRVYEHLIWDSRASMVIEIGVQHGASALWFRDRLRTLHAYGHIGSYRVLGIDVDTAAARSNLDRVDPSWAGSIELLEGDVLDPALAARVRSLVAPGTRCLVVEDSLHTYETTSAALHGFAPLVEPGCYLVVEDGCVDVEEMRLSSDWPRGVIPAVEDWLATEAAKGFALRRDLELYGVSCHPHGFLQRVPQ